LRDGGFDVLHVHEPAAPSLSLLACITARGPIAATFHSANPGSRMLSAASGALQPVLGKIGGRISVSASASTGQLRHLDAATVEIPNGVVIERFEDAAPLPGWPGPAGAVGFLGRFGEPRKGFPVLLEALEQLVDQRPGLRLLVAGPGDVDGIRSSLPAALRERAVFLGLVSEADKARMLRSVDVYVAPNLGGESFGMILTEAMAAGTPIAASDLPAFRTVLDGGQAGVLFRTGDAQALTDALARLLADRARQRDLVTQGRRAVRAYDWRLVATQVLEVYEALLAPRREMVTEAR
jgi:phosphatidylinositol alpha-mannosyltransferase